MSSAPQIRRLAKPLFQKHRNLVMITGNIMTYRPVTHWTLFIYIQNWPKRGYFTVQ